MGSIYSSCRTTKCFLLPFKYVIMFLGDMVTIQTPSSVSASSYITSEDNADLTKNPTRAWQARDSDNNQFLTFNFQQQFYVVAVEMKGDQGWYVKSFYIEYYNEMGARVVYKVRFYGN